MQSMQEYENDSGYGTLWDLGSWPFVGDLTCLVPFGTSDFLDFSGISGTDKMSYVLIL